MRAVVWHGRRDVRVEQVPDPVIQASTDAIVRITSSGLCGSDLHLYEVMTPFMSPGDVLGHEPMGVVEEVGPEVRHLAPGDRVVVPFNISCGSCFMCGQGLQSQCETTQNRDHGTGASLFGYTKLYGAVAGGQAEYLRVPQAHYGPVKVPDGPADDRYVYLSDVLPTAWQAVEYASIPLGGTVAVLGLGPIGAMSARIAEHRGARVIGIDRVPERIQREGRRGTEVLSLHDVGDDRRDLADAVRDLTDGRGPDSVIDAVGMEAHGSGGAKLAQRVTGLLPTSAQEKLMEYVGIDRLAALQTAIDVVRRGGTISVAGVYGGTSDPLPMRVLFDKQVQLRMGQANVRRWTDQILPLLDDTDVLGVDDFATHHVALDEAPRAYEMFRAKQDGAIKVLFRP